MAVASELVALASPRRNCGGSYSGFAMEWHANVTRDLAAEVDATESSNMLDVVVELGGDLGEAADVAAAKEAFERAARPVADVIAGAGGEVLEGAWINQTLRARVPAAAISDLAGTDGVAVVDVPHALESE